LGDCFGGEVLRLGQLVGVFKRFVFEPRDVELVVASFDLTDMNLAEAAFGACVAALALAVWINAITFLEFGEVFLSERAFFLCNAREQILETRIAEKLHRFGEVLGESSWKLR